MNLFRNLVAEESFNYQPAASTLLRWDAVVIEQNPAVLELWRLAAKSNRKRVAFMNSTCVTAALWCDMDRDIPFYVDGSLPFALVDELTHQLAALGFMRIFVTLDQGYARNASFRHGRVLGKAPPWPPLGSQQAHFGHLTAQA